MMYKITAEIFLMDFLAFESANPSRPPFLRMTHSFFISSTVLVIIIAVVVVGRGGGGG